MLVFRAELLCLRSGFCHKTPKKASVPRWRSAEGLGQHGFREHGSRAVHQVSLPTFSGQIWGICVGFMGFVSSSSWLLTVVWQQLHLWQTRSRLGGQNKEWHVGTLLVIRTYQCVGTGCHSFAQRVVAIYIAQAFTDENRPHLCSVSYKSLRCLQVASELITWVWPWLASLKAIYILKTG